MNTYRVRVIKWGNGCNIEVKARDEQGALRLAKQVTGCPDAYIVKIIKLALDNSVKA